MKEGCLGRWNNVNGYECSVVASGESSSSEIGKEKMGKIKKDVHIVLNEVFPSEIFPDYATGMCASFG